MSTAPRTAPRRRAPARAYALAAVLALVLAATLGALAGLFRGDDFWLAAGVFAASTLGPSAALSWFLLVARHVVVVDAHPEENVERQWLDRAASSALTDLVIAAGVALVALSVTGLETSGSAVLVAVVVLGLADVTVRYLTISRRQS